MRIVFDVGHPGHVHLFKNVIWRLEQGGHSTLITARDKDITILLLDAYGFEYHYLSKAGQSILGLILELVQRDWRLLEIARRFQPDILVGIGDTVTHIGHLIGRPSVVFTDTEHVAIDRFLTYPFATVICTPECFKRDLGRRHVRYAGYHELAYLHPNSFQPTPTVLRELGISENEPFFVLRFVSWKASHDVGQQGFSSALKRRAIETLSCHGRVLISSETELPTEFQHLRLTAPPHRIHDVLAYAQLYLGEGATMATEAGLLGTPSVYTSSLVGKMGNFDELMDHYGLVYAYRDPAEALSRAVELALGEDTKSEWGRRRERLLEDKVDLTAWAVDLIEDIGGRGRRCP